MKINFAGRVTRLVQCCVPRLTTGTWAGIVTCQTPPKTNKHLLCVSRASILYGWKKRDTL